MADLTMKVFIGMSRVLKAIDRATDKVVHKYELTKGQFAVLEVLYHKGAMTIGRVQDRILTTSGNIPVIIGNLEKRGLLTRRKDEYDGRKWNLELTDAGRDLIRQVYPENEAVIRAHMAVFTEAEKEVMTACFKRFGGTTWNEQ